MANDFDFSTFKPIEGTKDYVDKYTNFVNAMEDYANEEEAARETETSILVNLTNNYLNYTLDDDVDGDSNTFKCTNMLDGTEDQDYITVSQANSLSAGSYSDIEDVGVGSLAANDIVVVNTTGSAFIGRPTTYTTLTTGITAVANVSYDMALSGGPKTVTLPDSPSLGEIISFADLGGDLTTTNKLTISPSTTPTDARYIMGQGIDETLVIDDYPFCSFDLIYTGISTFGWTLARFQR